VSETKKEKIASRLKIVKAKIEKKKKKGKKASTRDLQELKFYEEGHLKPECINIGCNNDVKWREPLNWSIKSECSGCTTARIKEKTIPGITIWKKTYCENVDGNLGFACPVNVEAWIGGHFKDSLDLDHIDGDHYNNIPENVRTLCKLCHNRSSREQKQWDGNKSTAKSY
jgi:hypothetical protein